MPTAVSINSTWTFAGSFTTASLCIKVTLIFVHSFCLLLTVNHRAIDSIFTVNTFQTETNGSNKPKICSHTSPMRLNWFANALNATQMQTNDQEHGSSLYAASHILLSGPSCQALRIGLRKWSKLLMNNKFMFNFSEITDIAIWHPKSAIYSPKQIHE